MQSKLSKTLLISSLLSVSLLGNDILSPEQKRSLNLSEEKIIKEADKLKNDWINPITYTYTYSDNEKMGISKTSTISISQPIFKSGGIFYAIKYAKNLKSSSLLSIDLQKKALVKQALNLAYTIKKTNLQIEQQKLAIQNATIDLKIKKESVLNGLLDTSFLNNAIITLNSQKSALLELEHAKLTLINNFNNLSNKSVEEIKLPVLSQLDQDTFTKNNLELNKNVMDVKVQGNLADMTKARYLPTVNVNYSKSLDHDTDDTNDVMGFNVVVPLDIKTFDAIDSSKAQYLKTKNDLIILKQSEINFFKSQNLKVAMLDAKIDLSKENITSYDELLTQMNELYNAGIKTKDDVTILENSKKSETLKIEIFTLEKQIELLEIYGKINSAEI